MMQSELDKLYEKVPALPHFSGSPDILQTQFRLPWMMH